MLFFLFRIELNVSISVGAADATENKTATVRRTVFPASLGFAPGGGAGLERIRRTDARTENKGHLTPQSGAKSTEGAVLSLKIGSAILGPETFLRLLSDLVQGLCHFSLWVEGLVFLLLEAERILLYYKTMKGTILAGKSTGFPQWVQWIHHDEGKHIVKYA